MRTIDTFYLAYEQYKKEFENNRDVHLFKKGASAHKSPNDFVSMVYTKCTIEEDWIAAIEKGLHYIAKAIKEDRQFIRNEGEVLPIEKIRRVSKDSIADLSKHSNYITRLPENPGDTVIPEKLLMIKRENDYAIYENRVVYTTLSYLKDFVSTRLDKIKEATNKYEGNLQIKKKIELGYRSVDVYLTINDIQKNDEYALAKNDAIDKIKRLDSILNGVLVLLKTPLMQELAKVPMVSRPVTKTNVLKMNTNFKESLAVFDYVCAYNKPGFEIEEVEKKIAPLSDEQENSFHDIVLLSSFLTYEYNNHLEIDLEKEYQKECKSREKIKDDEILAKIEKLMQEAHKSEKTIGEYLLALEEGYHVLEKRLQEAKDEVSKVVEEYEQKIVDLKEEQQKEIDTLNEYHDELVAKLQDEQLIEIATLNEEKEKQIQAFREECDQKVASITLECENRIEENRKNLEAQYQSTVDSQKQELETKQSRIQELEELVKAEQEKNGVLSKELDETKSLALAARLGKDFKSVSPKEYTNQLSFDELERQKASFDEFFENAWKEAKREIRKKHLTMKPKKEKKGDDHNEQEGQEN